MNRCHLPALCSPLCHLWPPAGLCASGSASPGDPPPPARSLQQTGGGNKVTRHLTMNTTAAGRIKSPLKRKWCDVLPHLLRLSIQIYRNHQLFQMWNYSLYYFWRRTSHSRLDKDNKHVEVKAPGLLISFHPSRFLIEKLKYKILKLYNCSPSVPDPCQLIKRVHVQLTAEMRKKRNHLQKDTVCFIQNIMDEDFLK